MGKTIVIDPGHGGWDKGAMAIDGVPEAVINWQFASALGKGLAAYEVEVIYTHEGDYTALANGDADLELRRRAAVANQHNADLFVSIHADSSGTPEARGGSAYIWTDKVRRLEDGTSSLLWLPAEGNHRAPNSHALAKLIVPPFRAALMRKGIPWRSYGDPDGISCADFGVLDYCNGPGILFETHFVTNPRDVEIMRTPGNIEALAESLAQAIAEALELSAKQKPRDSNAVTVVIYGQEVKCCARLEEGKTVGALRPVIEAMGGLIEWEDETQTLRVK